MSSSRSWDLQARFGLCVVGLLVMSGCVETEEPSHPVAQVSQSEAVATAGASTEQVTTTWLVMGVVDGDTLDVARGELTERVRVLGIDTPERGECGFDEATAALQGYVLGQQVHLTAGATDDRDRYGRVLRYVDRQSDGVDAGHVLLDAGQAIARYDSRDGYGPHPREVAYIVADETTPQVVCRATPASASTEASVVYADCAAVRVAGAAPIRAGDPGWDVAFDGDGDGVGCEA